MEILLAWLVLSFAIWITAMFLPGFEVRGFGGALIVAALFGVLNWLLGWLIFVLIGFATLGLGFILAFLTRWLVTAIMLKLTDALSSSLKIRSFGVALLGALIMTILGSIGEYFVHQLL